MTDPYPPSPPDEALPKRREPLFNIPTATGWLIAVNVLVHVIRQFLPPAQDDLVVTNLGFDASSIHGPIGLLNIVSLITYQFLHGGWDHLAINMISLLAFGAGVERPIGPLRYLIVYFLSGIAGALLESLFAPASGGDLLIGASASISGLFGALMLIWGLHSRGSNPMGLVRMILLWTALMAFTGIVGLGAPQGTPVAWIAHLGGFFAGIALGFVFRPRAMRI